MAPSDSAATTDRPPRWRSAAAGAWSLLFGGLLVYAALAKVRQPGATETFLIAYLRGLGHDGPAQTAGLLLYALVVGEILLGAMLISGQGQRAGLLGAAVFVCVLSALLVHARTLGLGGGCGCGMPAALQGDNLAWLLARNGVFAVGCVGSALLITPSKRLRREAAPLAPPWLRDEPVPPSGLMNQPEVDHA